MKGLFARVKSVALGIKARSFSYPRRKLRHAFLERTARRGRRRCRVTVALASCHCRTAVPASRHCRVVSLSPGRAFLSRSATPRWVGGLLASPRAETTGIDVSQRVDSMGPTTRDAATQRPPHPLPAYPLAGGFPHPPREVVVERSTVGTLKGAS